MILYVYCDLCLAVFEGLCVALCVVGSGRVGLRVTLLMEGAFISCDVCVMCEMCAVCLLCRLCVFLSVVCGLVRAVCFVCVIVTAVLSVVCLLCPG